MGVELTLVVQQDERQVRAERENGRQAFGTLQFEEFTRETVDIFQRWLAKGLLSSRAEFELLGKILYRVLFSGEIATEFSQALEAAQRPDRLSFRLGFDDPSSELANWPWEYLYCPRTGVSVGYFFSTHFNLSLSRRLAKRSPAPGKEPGPLRVRVAFSDPAALGPVSANPIKQVLESLKNEGLKLDIDVWEHVTAETLEQKLASETQPVHVLHFIGHGRKPLNEEGRIAFQPMRGSDPEWSYPEAFAELLSQGNAPRVVFLHLVEPGVGEDALHLQANFTALGPALLMAGIQAVVAMRFPIPSMAAEEFSERFYREIAQGRAVDVAVQKARNRLQTSMPDNRVFGVPVLYMDNRDEIIDPRAGAAEAQPVGAAGSEGGPGGQGASPPSGTSEFVPS
jgi:CHAT domain